MKNILVCLVSFALLANGQKAEKTNDRQTAADTQRQASLVNDETPNLTKGGIVAERELSGTDYKVHLRVSQPGTYVLVGRTGGGEEVRLGSLTWEFNSYFLPTSVPIFDSLSHRIGAPYEDQPSTIEVIWVDRGRLEHSKGNVSSSQQEPSKITATEGIRDGKYYLSMNSLPPDAVVILGRNAVGDIITTPGAGSTVIFPADAVIPQIGGTTITVCSKGKCETTSFERKVVFEQPSSGGKG